MTPILRRARGVAAIGLAWGVTFAAFAAVVSIVVGIVDPDSIDPGEGPVRVGTILGQVGLLSGVLFGALLALVESRRRIPDVSIARVAVWAVLASAVFPLATGREDQVFVICPVGLSIALSLLAIARSASKREAGQPRRLRDLPVAWVLASIRDAVGAA